MRHAMQVRLRTSDVVLRYSKTHSPAHRLCDPQGFEQRVIPCNALEIESEDTHETERRDWVQG